MMFRPLLGDGRPEANPCHKLLLKLEVAREGMNRSDVPTSETEEPDDRREYDLGVPEEGLPKLLLELRR